MKLSKKNLFRSVAVASLVIGLLMIRHFQQSLFYDPFLEYFATDNIEKTVPDYDAFSLYSNIILRYLLNSMVSVGIVALLFQKKDYTLTSTVVYAILGILFLITYSGMVENNMLGGEKLVFYVRRFLIQPLILLILIPAFYFLQIKEKQTSEMK